MLLVVCLALEIIVESVFIKVLHLQRFAYLHFSFLSLLIGLKFVKRSVEYLLRLERRLRASKMQVNQLRRQILGLFIWHKRFRKFKLTLLRRLKEREKLIGWYLLLTEGFLDDALDTALRFKIIWLERVLHVQEVLVIMKALRRVHMQRGAGAVDRTPLSRLVRYVCALGRHILLAQMQRVVLFFVWLCLWL